MIILYSIWGYRYMILIEILTTMHLEKRKKNIVRNMGLSIHNTYRDFDNFASWKKGKFLL